MSEAVLKLYRIMLKDHVSKLESHYFDKTCLMIFIGYSKKIDDFWHEENTETVILDCEGYWKE